MQCVLRAYFRRYLFVQYSTIRRSEASYSTYQAFSQTSVFVPYCSVHGNPMDRCPICEELLKQYAFKTRYKSHP